MVAFTELNLLAMTPTAHPIHYLQTLEDSLREMPESPLRMDCLCLLASGMDNAGETLGWDETEEFAHLALRSLETLLCDSSEEIQAVFKAKGITF